MTPFKFLIVTRLCFFFSVHAFGQTDSVQIYNDSDNIKDWSSKHAIIAWKAGIYNFNMYALNGYLENSYGRDFPEQNWSFGVMINQPVRTSRKRDLDNVLEVQFLAPISNQATDSLKFILSGFYLGYNLSADLFPNQSAFDLSIGLGFNAGRQKIELQKLSVSSDYMKYTNPFFAPMIFIEPRVVLLKRITLSLRGELQIDATKPNWKLKNSALEPLPESNATGYMLHLTLGWNGWY